MQYNSVLVAHLH